MTAYCHIQAWKKSVSGSVVSNNLQFFSRDAMAQAIPTAYPIRSTRAVGIFRQLQSDIWGATCPWLLGISRLRTVQSRDLRHEYCLSREGWRTATVFYPRFESLLAGVGEETLELEWTRENDSPTTVRRYLRKESVDKINQNFSAQFIYRTYRDGRLINEETAPLKMSYYTYPHLRALFLLAGLEIAEEYGSSEKAPLDNDFKEMFFVLQRSSQ